jgi:hypothetical protein
MEFAFARRHGRAPDRPEVSSAGWEQESVDLSMKKL